MNEYNHIFHSMVTLGITCGLNNSIEWLLNYELHVEPLQKEFVIKYLCEMYEWENMKKPDNYYDISNWINNHYSHNNKMWHNCYDCYEISINNYIKHKSF